jgi:hypothetical protein
MGEFMGESGEFFDFDRQKLINMVKLPANK